MHDLKKLVARLSVLMSYWVVEIKPCVAKASPRTQLVINNK
jgi:hypothetical protein